LKESFFNRLLVASASQRLQTHVLKLLIVGSIVYFFSYPEVDNDLWGHLFFGGEIFHAGSIPSTNQYSYTAPEHLWINHEWLSEVVFYGIFNLLGSPGLILLKTTVAMGVLLFVNSIMRRRVASFVPRALALVWVMALLSPGFNVRPQIFTYLLLSVALLILYASQENQTRRLYWLLPLMALWANLHGGFLSGIGALALFFMWSAVFGRDNVRRHHLMIASALAVLGVVLNPYSVELVRFVATDILVDRRITEWDPIPIFAGSFLDFKVAVLVAVFLALKAARRRWDGWLVMVTAILAFRHQRHTPLFAIAAAPFLAEAIESGLLRMRTKAPLLFDKPAQAVWALLVAVVSVSQLAFMGSLHLKQRLQLVIDPHEFPLQAVQFLQRNEVRGNLAAPFGWGEYLIWKLYPNIRIAIDGRYTTAYPMTVIDDSWNWMEGTKDWKRLVDAYPTDLVMTHRNHPVTALLRREPEWMYIYSDPVAFIFVRDVPAQKELLEKFRKKELVRPWAPPPYFPG
jgi:hypothetical protein